MELIKQITFSRNDCEYLEEFYRQSQLIQSGTAWFFQKSCKRIVEISNDFTHEHGRFFLSIPDLVFKIRFAIYKNEKTIYYKQNGIYVVAVSGISEKSFFLPLPNIFGDGSICLGEFSTPNTLTSSKDLAKFEVTYFWNSIFELSEVWTKEYVKDGRCKGFKVWHQNTKENPDWCPDENDLHQLSEISTGSFWAEKFLIGQNGQELGPQYDNFKDFFLEKKQ